MSRRQYSTPPSWMSPPRILRDGLLRFKKLTYRFLVVLLGTEEARMATNRVKAEVDYGWARETLCGMRDLILEEVTSIKKILSQTEKSPDHFVECENRNQVDIYFQLLEMKDRQLLQIEGALLRIRGGSYGACRRCGEPIAPERLRALPFAIRCCRCEEKKSSKKKSGRLMKFLGKKKAVNK